MNELSVVILELICMCVFIVVVIIGGLYLIGFGGQRLILLYLKKKVRICVVCNERPVGKSHASKNAKKNWKKRTGKKHKPKLCYICLFKRILDEGEKLVAEDETFFERDFACILPDVESLKCPVKNGGANCKLSYRHKGRHDWDWVGYVDTSGEEGKIDIL